MCKSFTIRNRAGQFLASYRAKDKGRAIAKFIHDQQVMASQFKGMRVVTDVVAEEESST